MRRATHRQQDRPCDPPPAPVQLANRLGRDRLLDQAWCLRVPAGEAAAAAVAALRDTSGIQVLRLSDATWLRGRGLTTQMTLRLDGIPGGTRYDIAPQAEDGMKTKAEPGAETRSKREAAGTSGALRIRLPGRRLAAGTLPAPDPGDSWQALAAASLPTLPSSALPGTIADEATGCTDTPALLQLRRTIAGQSIAGQSIARQPIARQPTASDGERPIPNLLRTTLAELQAWAIRATQVRLCGLRFAANRNGEVLVHGRPLPPLPGPVWIEQHGVAIPAGYSWYPPVPLDLVAESLRMGAQDLAVFSADGTCLRIADSELVALRRSAVRATTAELPK